MPTTQDPLIVKLGSGDHFYNTETSSYITLDELGEINKSRRVTILDVNTQKDRTQEVFSTFSIRQAEVFAGRSRTEPISVKFHSDRGLYETEMSNILTLADLMQMARKGEEFVILDATTGDDLTHSVLTQMVVEQGTHSREAREGNLRPARLEREPIVIKKYANRRLYNTEISAYVTLGDLAQMVREEKDFVVFDARTGDDLTHNVLTQIVVDQEARASDSGMSHVPDPEPGPQFAPNSRNLIDVDRGSLLTGQELNALQDDQRILVAAAKELLAASAGSNAYAGLRNEITRYLEAIDRPLNDMRDGDIVEIYRIGLRVDSVHERLLRDVESGEVPDPGEKISVPLAELRGFHGPFILSTTIGEELILRAERYNKTPADDIKFKELIRPFDNAIRDSTDVFSSGTKIVVSDANANIGLGPNPSRSGDYARSANRNVLIALAKIAARGAATGVAGAAFLNSPLGPPTVDMVSQLYISVYEFLLANQTTLRLLATSGGEGLSWLRPFLDWIDAHAFWRRKGK